MSSVRHVVVPADARMLSTLGRIDYEDGFSVDLPEVRERTAEQWARAVIENAPGSFRTSLPRGWRALGLKHGPVDSESHVLGWPIRTNTPDVVLLGDPPPVPRTTLIEGVAVVPGNRHVHVAQGPLHGAEEPWCDGVVLIDEDDSSTRRIFRTSVPGATDAEPSRRGQDFDREAISPRLEQRR